MQGLCTMCALPHSSGATGLTALGSPLGGGGLPLLFTPSPLVGLHSAGTLSPMTPPDSAYSRPLPNTKDPLGIYLFLCGSQGSPPPWRLSCLNGPLSCLHPCTHIPPPRCGPQQEVCESTQGRISSRASVLGAPEYQTMLNMGPIL